MIGKDRELLDFALQLAEDTRFPRFIDALMDEQAAVMRRPDATLDDLKSAHDLVRATDALRARVMRVKSDLRMAERRK